MVYANSLQVYGQRTEDVAALMPCSELRLNRLYVVSSLRLTVRGYTDLPFYSVDNLNFPAQVAMHVC